MLNSDRSISWTTMVTYIKSQQQLNYVGDLKILNNGVCVLAQLSQWGPSSATLSGVTYVTMESKNGNLRATEISSSIGFTKNGIIVDGGVSDAYFAYKDN